MLKLDLTFHLTENARKTFLRNGLTEISPPKDYEVFLEALSVSIEAGKSTYQVASDRRSEPDGIGPVRGMLWPRSLLPIGDGVAIEQQMLFSATGDAVVFLWRLVGRATFLVQLKAAPIFSATRSFSDAGFAIEPETMEVAWRGVPFIARPRLLPIPMGASLNHPTASSPAPSRLS
jgi:hypothetical protein